ncbi:precorrin-6A/cobalt-precorrin-6A reductase [Aliiroseovarius halocynthiae]|uniref:Precorrin-6A/cobalt-precorrin-6A reductase n=1 Tax=Aliiroseovarius halocynthiae TaxID=985055 RepID=A0A545SVL9_9RHOB|nr:precorrin-6A/cobalt-precorrin-6A reductase [Aliiroseovarius halocynthiae]TQV69012.1 precorrin-6A/cobalt-precorrin-6A reductase [Aliiroseovarius halocynthiae]SMR71762.1 precorrin-6A/cobalt-precorrin-6A reductase [Aliiroseovarius halocynthiae]
MKILLLAGTSEAREFAELAATDGHQVLASLAGVTRLPKPYPVPTRHGGFGGQKAQLDFLQEGAFDAIIDATHPFATRIAPRSQRIAERLDVPYLRLLRPAWTAGPEDRWHVIATPGEAAQHIPISARVLLATGAMSLEEWSGLAGDRILFCRRVDPTDTPFPFEGGWIIGRPPFSIEDEVEVLRGRQITHIVCKNAGGPARAKLDAARQLGLPVIMQSRPPMPDCPIAETPQEAMRWLNTLKR